MSVFKAAISSKTGILLLVVVVLLVFLLSRNSQAIVRAFVGQEISWSTAEFNTVQTEHFTIKYLPVDESYVQAIGEVAEDAYNVVGDEFDYQPEGRTTIVIYPDSGSLAKSFGWEKDQKAMGVYWAGSIRILSPQKWIDDENWIDVFSSEGPIYHEFAHLLVDDMTHGNYSRWFTEGVAQYEEKRITGFEFKTPFSEGEQVQYYSFKELDQNFDGLDQQIVYWESLQAIEYMVERYGPQSVNDVMKNLRDGHPIYQAIEKALGTEFDSFEKDFYENLNDI